MKSYVIANYSIEPAKEEEYSSYPLQAARTTLQYGGRILVATKDSRTIEGEPENITVVLEFDSQADVERWYSSDEYSAIKNLRVQSMNTGWILSADEFQMPQTS